MDASKYVRWVLVTGGSRGIGKGIVEHLCRAGYPVVFTYKASAAAAEELEAAMREAGHTCQAVRCDGAVLAEVDTVVSDLVNRIGVPCALVNNMGITRDALLVNANAEDWLEVLHTNLTSSFYFARSVGAGMMARRSGVILQMGSVSGQKGIAGQTAYAATKAGMSGMTRALALEVGRFNVRVNVIAPGFIRTEMLNNKPSTELKSIEKQIPLRRLGNVEDVAQLVEFLISDNASYITGQTIVIDGGLSA